MRIARDPQTGRRMLAAVGGLGGIAQTIYRGPAAAGPGTSQSTSALLGADVEASMLEGIIDDEEKTGKSLQAVYRDIYHHDHIAGAAVDLRSTMPWSDFKLVGSDDERLEVFNSTLDRLNVRSLHKELSADYLVTGAFIGMLVRNSDVFKEGFTDIMPFDYGDCEIKPVPLYSQDPLITLNLSEEYQTFANDESPDAIAMKRNMPPGMVAAMKAGGNVDLNPLMTLYIPRTTLTSNQTGVSFYRRILPQWLLERVLYKGTITEATRRQAATLHIMAGGPDWVPTNEELQELVGLFQQAETDPTSAILATPTEVRTQDVLRQSSDLRWTDLSRELGEAKFMALGTSQQFLMGEANYQTAEVGLAVFLEDLENFRNWVTRRLYYQRIFQMVAFFNDFRKEESKGTGSRKVEESAVKVARLQSLQIELNDSWSLDTPLLEWYKKLRPEANRDYLDILTSLSESGVPVPLRLRAAAGGLDIDRIVDEMPEDKNIRDKLKQYRPPPEELEGGGGGGRGFFSSVDEDGEDEETAVGLLGDVAVSPREVVSAANILLRPYAEEDMEVYREGKTGKREYVFMQQEAHKRINETAGRALRNLADQDTFANAIRKAYSLGLVHRDRMRAVVSGK